MDKLFCYFHPNGLIRHNYLLAQGVPKKKFLDI